MPELPDLAVYLDALTTRIVGQPLERLRIGSPFVLRSVLPPAGAFEGQTVTSIERMGKRIVIGFTGDLYAVIHLMIAGRFRWAAPGAALPGRIGLGAFDFHNGSLLLTEAGRSRRASLHLVQGAAGLAEFDRGGLEVLSATAAEFAAVLTRENHTLKRALTDPRLFSGIGNAYSDEILHRAGLSPVRLTRQLGDAELTTLFEATRAVLREWTDRLRQETGDGFPEKVTAFRHGMAVHGRYNQPCPVCGTPVQRIRYAANETNYCPTCQTGGRLLADRALSRLLREDWPRSLEELDELRQR